MSTPAFSETTLADLALKHEQIFLLVAPPRSASTALARVFWRHPAIGYYCHEPFNLVYHGALGVEKAGHALTAAALEPASPAGEARGSCLLVKEMTFQVGEHFDSLAALTSKPVVFLVRDPRLTIASRRRKRQEGGQDPSFPLNESGWADLDTQIRSCQTLGVPYLLLDASDFRNHPENLVEALFGRLDLDFSEELLAWSPATHQTLGALGTEQSHWYQRVLTSERVEPATEQPPDVDSFPERGGLRSHVAECLGIYRRLLEDPNRLTPQKSVLQQ